MKMDSGYRCLLVLLIAVFISAPAVSALAGNNNASGVRSFMVDNTKPSVTGFIG
jgi:hypothetical protein